MVSIYDPIQFDRLFVYDVFFIGLFVLFFVCCWFVFFFYVIPVFGLFDFSAKLQKIYIEYVYVNQFIYTKCVVNLA